MLKKALMVPAMLLASTSAFAQAGADQSGNGAATDSDSGDIIVTAQKR